MEVAASKSQKPRPRVSGPRVQMTSRTAKKRRGRQPEPDCEAVLGSSWNVARKGG